MRRFFRQYYSSYADLRSLPRACWALGIATFANRAGMMAIPFLSLYLVRARGFTAAEAAFLVGIYGVGGIIAAPISGWLCDRLGATRMIRDSVAIGGCALLVLPWLESFASLAVIIGIFALANESFRPASAALVAQLVDGSRRRQAIAFYRLAINLGMSVGPMIGAVLAVRSFPALFVTNAVACFATAAIAHWGIVPYVPKDLGGAAGPTTSMRSLLHNRTFVLFAIMLLPSSIVFFQHESVLPLHLVQQLHFPETIYGLTFTMNTLLIVFFEIPLLAATKHWKHKHSIAIGAFLSALGFLLLAVVRTEPLYFFSVLLWSFGEMLFFPIAHAYIADATPANAQGRNAGLFVFLLNIGFAVAPILGVRTLEFFGWFEGWWVIGAFGMVSVALAFILPNPKKEPIPVA